MTQMREVNRSINLYNKALHILKERITMKMISKIVESLELSLPKRQILGRAYAMCWASVELIITILKEFTTKEPAPGNVAKRSVILLQFMNEYFSFLGLDPVHGKLITASKHIDEAYKILEQVDFDIPEAVDEFIHRLENKVFPNASPVTMSTLQDLITHLRRKYEGAKNITTNWEVFITNFNQVNIDSFEEVYIFVKRECALPTSHD